jgi:hypothetical protein
MIFNDQDTPIDMTWLSMLLYFVVPSTVAVVFSVTKETDLSSHKLSLNQFIVQWGTWNPGQSAIVISKSVNVNAPLLSLWLIFSKKLSN